MPLTSSRSAPTRQIGAVLRGGFILAHATGLLVAGIGTIAVGSTALVSALIGMMMVILFFSFGQVIELITISRATIMGLVITLASYIVRVTLLWVGMQEVSSLLAGQLLPRWLAIGVVSGTVGWLAGMLTVVARQRMPIYDVEYRPPSGWDAG